MIIKNCGREGDNYEKLRVVIDRQLRTDLKLSIPLRKNMFVVINLYGKIFALGESSCIQYYLLLRSIGVLGTSVSFVVSIVFRFRLHSTACNKKCATLASQETKFQSSR